MTADDIDTDAQGFRNLIQIPKQVVSFTEQ